jgi:hypothetical protein
MGRLERRINNTSLAVALAKNPKPHRHSNGGTPIISGAPLPPRPAGKWPSPKYAERRKVQAERAAARAKIAAHHRPPALALPPVGLNAAQRLIEALFLGAGVMREFQDRIARARKALRLERSKIVIRGSGKGERARYARQEARRLQKQATREARAT